MKLTYIHHSCYLIENEEYNLLFDFWQDTIDASAGEIHSRILQEDKPLYIFVTHHHYDHFNPEILEWKDKYKGKIIYIISSDVGITNDFIIKMDKGLEYSDNKISVKAFGSTDEGISFRIKTKDKVIFHAGDLNNWHWREECPAEESLMYENNYLKELNDLAKETQYINLAMFPIDPRLGKDYMLGAEQFIDLIKTDIFAPMHFQNNYDCLDAFESYADSKKCKLFRPTKRGDSILL